MDRVLVVGSGASGVHFALTLLRRGRAVTLVDVGRPPTPPVEPEATLSGLKERLEDPAGYFLGRRFQGVLLPDSRGEYYGIPPSKDYVFETPGGFGFSARGFAPLFSFAQGGLAQVWTGGCYPYNDTDLRDYPFAYADLAPHYGEVARRIGIAGVEDDLAPYMPVHDGLLAPLEADAHTRILLDVYRRKRRRLHRRGVRLGRTRAAVLTSPRGHRKACAYLGRCLWGCPVGAFYTPSLTLDECRAHPAFSYLDGHEALFFRTGDGGRVRSLVVRRLSDDSRQELPVDRLVLAAGTLGSARILLESARRAGGETPVLRGLMDNRQVLLPFVNWRLMGRPFKDESYQYHLLGLILERADAADTVFGLVTTLKTALLHPIVQSLPFDLRTSLDVTRALHAALGLVNVNFRDTRRPDNQVTLDEAPRYEGPPARLRIRYAPGPDEPERVRAGLRDMRRALRTLGCFVPPGMAHLRPMGASVHYAGTVPMSAEPAPWTTTPQCRSREFPNLWLADGSTFPFLPAKNCTFTLMANAVRVATAEF